MKTIEILNALDYALECIEDGDAHDAHDCIVVLVEQLQETSDYDRTTSIMDQLAEDLNPTTHEKNQ
jgi:hypothetical protein